MKNEEPCKPVPMSQLMETIQDLKKAAAASRDKKSLVPDVAAQNTWHFFNGKIQALQDLEAQLELYSETFPATREIDPTEWLRVLSDSIDDRRKWVHPDDVPGFERRDGDAGCAYRRLNDGSLEAVIDTGLVPAPSKITMRYRLDPPVELSLCWYDELYVIWSPTLDCHFIAAYGRTPEGDSDILRVSVNLFEEPTPHGCFFCRDEHFHEQFIAELVERKILLPTDRREGSGHITIPMFKFAPLTEAVKL